MSIYRKARPNSNFYLLDKAISEDVRLSWGARGLLVFLLGKPDHWRVSTSHLVKQTEASGKPAKRDAVRALLGELIAAGYVVRESVRDDQGVFKGVEYVVSEIPREGGEDSPATDKPGPDNPAPVNPPLVSIEGLASNETPARTDNPPTPQSPVDDLLGSDGAQENDPPADPDVTLPEWLDAEAWQAFVEHRKQMKAKMTAKAKTMLLNKLGKLCSQGHDPKAILEESIINGWKGVFAPKAPQGGRQPLPRSGFAETDYREGLGPDDQGVYRL